MPHESFGRNRGFRIDAFKACPWLVKYAHEPKPESPRERLFREQADRVALSNAKTRSDLVDAVQLHHVLQAIFATVRTQWSRVSERCASDIAAMSDPQEVRTRLETEFAEVGNQLHSVVGKIAGALESVE